MCCGGKNIQKRNGGHGTTSHYSLYGPCFGIPFQKMKMAMVVRTAAGRWWGPRVNYCHDVHWRGKDEISK
jgi:hypothetical protein